MRQQKTTMPSISVIIPAFNEADAITQVIRDLPDSVHKVIVVSNGSTDNTESNAKQIQMMDKNKDHFLQRANKVYSRNRLKSRN